MMTTLLSIDWDWVTGDCADGKHGCCGWCAPSQRKFSRGSDRLVAPGWVDRLEALYAMAPVEPGGNLWIAECHADILRVVDPDDMTDIIHLDSHLDDADWCALSCGSWRTFLPVGIGVTMPAAKRGGHRPVTVGNPHADLAKLAFHDVFVCQSSPWTPSSMDHLLWDLVGHLVVLMGHNPGFIGHRRMAQARAWDQARRKAKPEVEARP